MQFRFAPPIFLCGVVCYYLNVTTSGCSALAVSSRINCAIASDQGSADVNAGRGAIVIGLAAVIISEVIFGKLCAGKKITFAYTLAAVFVGAILYYIAYTLVLWLRMPSDYMKLFSAIVVACFLAIPYLKDKYAVKRRMAR